MNAGKALTCSVPGASGRVKVVGSTDDAGVVDPHQEPCAAPLFVTLASERHGRDRRFRRADRRDHGSTTVYEPAGLRGGVLRDEGPDVRLASFRSSSVA
jgi:hypothetical protein